MPKSVLSVFANVPHYFYEDFIVKKKEKKNIKVVLIFLDIRPLISILYEQLL